MYIKEQLMMHNIASQLVHDNGYEILHINEQNDEIWLEKYKDRVSNVIRLTHKGFDWKNELKADLSKVFQKTSSMGKLLVGKQVQIFNVYVATYVPVDDWENLKAPIEFKSRKQMTMNMYYLTADNIETELTRLAKNLNISIEISLTDEHPLIIEKKVQTYKQSLHHTLHATRNKVQSVFSFGKPLFTYILLAINIIFFFIVELNGGSTDISNLINFGAKYNPAIIDGEWWRIVSAMFLHIGMFHLFMNMLALYYLGIAVERIYGSIRFIFIYFIAGIGGGLTSFALTINVSAGASGAIFGLFGALLFFGLHERKLFLQTMGRGVLFLIGFNIIFGFVAPQIDNGAHLGGLIAGFLGSAIVHLPKAREMNKQFIAALIYSLMIVTLVLYGIQNGPNNAMYHLDQIDDLRKNGQYEKVVLHASEGLQKKSKLELESQLYFQRSYAYIELDQYDLAIADLENNIILLEENDMLQSDFSESYFKSYFNLAILYFETGNIDKAKDAVQQAYKLNPDPDKDDIVELYKEIIGEYP